MRIRKSLQDLRGAALTLILGASATLAIARAISAGRDVIMAAKFGDGPEVGAYFIGLALHAATSFVLADAVVVAGSRAILQTRSAPTRVLAGAGILSFTWVTLQVMVSQLVPEWLRGEFPRELQTALVWMAFGGGGIILIAARKAIHIATGSIIKSARLDVAWALGSLLIMVLAAEPRIAIYGSWSISLGLVALIAVATSLHYANDVTDKSQYSNDGFATVLPIIGASVLYQAMFLAQRGIGAQGGDMLLAALGYGYKLTALPVMLTLSGLSAWALRAFHLRLRDRGVEGFRAYIAQTLGWSGAAGVATAAVLAATAPTIVSVVLQRGAFDSALAQSTVAALRGYAFAVPSMITYVILVRAFQTTNKLGVPVVASAMGLLSCISVSLYAINTAAPEFALALAIGAASLTASVVMALSLFAPSYRKGA